MRMRSEGIKSPPPSLSLSLSLLSQIETVDPKTKGSVTATPSPNLPRPIRPPSPQPRLAIGRSIAVGGVGGAGRIILSLGSTAVEFHTQNVLCLCATSSIYMNCNQFCLHDGVENYAERSSKTIEYLSSVSDRTQLSHLG